MDCIERIFVLESEQGSAKVVCARENRKNTSMSLMKAIWQKESRQQFLEQTHTKKIWFLQCIAAFLLADYHGSLSL